MASSSGFDLFIADQFNLYNRLREELQSNRLYVAAACRRAGSALRFYPPTDDGEAILLETAIEQFEDLLRQAGGRT
jgi:hypothetical protein